MTRWINASIDRVPTVRLVLAAAAAMLVSTSGASAAVLFQDDFNDGNIDGWGNTGVAMPITVVGGVVDVAPSGTSNAFYTIRPSDGGNPVLFDTGGASVISLSADIHGQSGSSTHTSNELGLYLTFSAAASPNDFNRYDFRFHTGSGGADNANDRIRIRKSVNNGPVTNLAEILEADAGLTNAIVNNNFIHFELRVTLGDTSNLIELFADDDLILSATDASPSPMSYAGLAVWGNGNNDIRFDNVVLETVPEPMSAALMGVCGGIVFGRRRG